MGWDYGATHHARRQRQPESNMRYRYTAAIALLAWVTACIPYTVGSTARPVRVGDHSTTMSTFVMPSFGRLDSTRSLSNIAVDFERRWGVDSRSDVGVRITSGSGMVVNYKRLLTRPDVRAYIAIMSGAGFINMGQHAHFELTLLASRHDGSRASGSARDSVMRPMFVPYGGLRVMQVAPLAEGAVKDQPTIGGFLGLRFGSTDFGLSPEIGVFYDHSALDVRKRNVVVVPAISAHGDRMVQLIRELLGMGGGILFTR